MAQTPDLATIAPDTEQPTGGLLEQIVEPERRNQVVTDHPLWDNWRLFALFTLVIVVEWVLRKRVRMM